MELKAQKVSDVLKIISNKNRLLILCYLEEGKLSVGQLSEKIDSISMAAISQHLNALKLAGIVENEKKGLSVFYHISDMRVVEVMKTLIELYCK